MPALDQLEPRGLWQLFQQICAIPHPSGQEQALKNWIWQWGQQQRLQVAEDRAGNLILRKAAMPGREQARGVILQAHLDMVPQKNHDSTHDFACDPILPVIEGDWVRAQQTTLGADNGIGMASALAVLASRDIAHGPLEVLLTVNEEAGMSGALGLEPGLLQGSLLINTDSEQEGDIYIGCAGGVDACLRFPCRRQALPAGYRSFELALSGLRGGHSGCDIHLGRANANQLLTRALLSVQASLDIRLQHLQGGSLRNAIPREASAVIAIASSAAAALQQHIDQLQQQFMQDYAEREHQITLTLKPASEQNSSIAAEDQQRLLAALTICPNGVMQMSAAFAGVVESSLNMGVLRSLPEAVELLCLVRSQSDSARGDIEHKLQALAALAGAGCELSGGYPGWAPRHNGALLQSARTVYQQLFNRPPSIKVIHAGLECGLFLASYPHWDMISIGPTIQSPHSPDERVNIDSVAHYWHFLCALLSTID